MSPFIVNDQHLGAVLGGKPLRLLEMALSGQIAIITSHDILNETLGVLRDKFKLSEWELTEAKGRIESVAWGVIRPNERIREVQSDPDDDRVLECAVQRQERPRACGEQPRPSLSIPMSTVATMHSAPLPTGYRPSGDRALTLAWGCGCRSIAHAGGPPLPRVAFSRTAKPRRWYNARFRGSLVSR